MLELKEIMNNFCRTEELEIAIAEFYEAFRDKYNQGKFGEHKWYELVKEFDQLMDEKLVKLNVDAYVKYSTMED